MAVINLQFPFSPNISKHTSSLYRSILLHKQNIKHVCTALVSAIVISFLVALGAAAILKYKSIPIYLDTQERVNLLNW